MSDNIESLSDHKRKKRKLTLEEAVKAASQHVRNHVPDDLEEPQGFASGGDMKKILEESEDKEDDETP